MGQASTKPVISGGSYLSQHSLELHFGLGEAVQGVIEIMWPGGVRNRLYDVNRGEQVVIPEIPCSFDAEWNSQGAYLSCVNRALNDLARAGVITPNEKTRYRESALQAYRQ